MESPIPYPRDSQMLSADPTSFKDLAHRVNYAHKNTQRQYDKYPPNDDMVPIAAAINAWTLVCGFASRSNLEWAKKQGVQDVAFAKKRGLKGP